MDRIASLTRHLKRYDSELYAELSKPLGRAKSEAGASTVYVLRRNRSNPHEPHFVFALTEDWTWKSNPRDWGVEVVMNRIRALDLWKDETVVDRVLAEHAETEASEKRSFRNTVESFLIDFRRQFARATNDVNTSLLPKIDSRRKGDLKYGS